jgi:outer membrane protein OmpA-like peptidoglycan-associated protein
MLKNHIILFIFAAMLCSFSACAQKLSSKNKKAVNSYKQGIEYYNVKDFRAAESKFTEAVEMDNKFIEAHQLLAMLYEETYRYEKAIEHYKTVQKLNNRFQPNNYYFMALLMMKTGKYEEARDHFQIYAELKDANPALQGYCTEQIRKAEFAIGLKMDPVPFEPVNLGPEINTQHAEYSPTITADEEILYFTKLRPRDRNTAHSMPYEEDFYFSRKINGEWTTAIPLGHPVNTYGNEGAATISPDGMQFIYTACNRGDGMGSCDLYISKREGGKWSAPENMGAPVNTAHWESQPSIAPDGKTLYFAREYEGRADIFVTILDEHGQWETPVNLGEPINTSSFENSPFIHPDGKTLYFMSNGHPGMGGMDIFISRKQDDGSWSEPVNLGYPINTHRDEGFFIVSASGKTAYFASDQLNGFGHFDLYSFELPEEVRPDPVTYLKGFISDSESNKPIVADFQLFNLETGKLVVQSVSDETDGSFLVCLPTNATYALHVNKKNYLFHSEHFDLTAENTSKDPVIRNFKLHPIRTGEIVVMNNIFFDFDSDQLKSESLIELNKLIQLLTDNQSMHIEIRGHTDNVGSGQYNMTLSEKRATSVYNYLIKNEISKNRLSFRGYGDTVPIASNDTEEGRALNRRTEFRVTKF